MATRPVQLMSDTSAAIRAAKEVQADTLAPELYRQSNEWFFRAKREYKIKNFLLAKEYASKAQLFAEQAEFEAVRNGGNRGDAGGADPLANNVPAPDPAGAGGASTSPEAPMPMPTPAGTPAEEFEQRKAADDEARRKAEEEAKKAAAPPPVPTPNPNDVVLPPILPRR